MSHLILWPVLLPLLAGILLILTRGWLPLPVRRGINLAATLGLVGLALLLLGAVADGSLLTYRVGNWPAPWGIVLVADRLAAYMLLITALLALVALVYAVRGGDRGSRHFQSLFQLQLFGLNGAFLTGDIFNLFVFFEVLLLASYGLLLHGGGAPRVRAGLHFVAVNLVGSTVFLFAAGTLYGTLGTLNMADLAVRIAATPPENLGLVRTAGLLLFAVFALKAALLPLSLWLPRAYSATSAPVAALFAIMTKVGAYCLLRIGTLLFGDAAGPAAGLYAPWLLPLAAGTLLLGSLGALAAGALRLQAAWLVVVSVGLLLTAIGLWTPAAAAAGLYYLAHSTFATAALFLLTDVLARRRGRCADALVPGPALPAAGLLGGVFVVTAILLAGLPPLSGFFGKMLILRAALAEPGWPWLFALVLGTSLLGIVTLARTGSVLFLAARGRAIAQPNGMPLALAGPDRTGPPPKGAPLALAEPDLAGPPPAGLPWALAPVLTLLALGVGLVLFAAPVFEFTSAAAAQLWVPQTYLDAVLHAQPAGTRR